MSRSSVCPRCQGSMSEGFILDKTDSRPVVSSWVEGEPVKSMWTGIRLSGRKRIEIQTFRCRRCGYLESYAPD